MGSLQKSRVRRARLLKKLACSSSSPEMELESVCGAELADPRSLRSLSHIFTTLRRLSSTNILFPNFHRRAAAAPGHSFEQVSLPFLPPSPRKRRPLLRIAALTPLPPHTVPPSHGSPLTLLIRATSSTSGFNYGASAPRSKLPPLQA
jgi:hypothetical protein